MPVSGSMACEGSYPHQNSYTESKNKRYSCAVRRDGEIHPRPISTVRTVQLQKLAMETGIHIYVWCLIFE